MVGKPADAAMLLDHVHQRARDTLLLLSIAHAGMASADDFIDQIAEIHKSPIGRTILDRSKDLRCPGNTQGG